MIRTLATSIDCERAFSAAGSILTKRRNRLSDENSRTAFVLSSWFRNTVDVVAGDEFKASLSDGWHRGKGKLMEVDESAETVIEVE